MTNDTEDTPIDRPPLLSDIRAIQRAVHGIQDTQLKMYEQLKSQRQAFRLPVAVCVVSALVCLASVFLRFS